MDRFADVKWNGWIPVDKELPDGGPDPEDVQVLLQRFDGEKYYYEIFHGYYDAGSEGCPAKWFTNMHNSCHVVGVAVYPNGEAYETDDRVIAWRHEPELPENLPVFKLDDHEVLSGRQKDLMVSMIAKLAVAKDIKATSIEMIECLLDAGFDPEELVLDFGYKDVNVKKALDRRKAG